MHPVPSCSVYTVTLSKSARSGGTDTISSGRPLCPLFLLSFQLVCRSVAVVLSCFVVFKDPGFNSCIIHDEGK